MHNVELCPHHENFECDIENKGARAQECPEVPYRKAKQLDVKPELQCGTTQKAGPKSVRCERQDDDGAELKHVEFEYAPRNGEIRCRLVQMLAGDHVNNAGQKPTKFGKG
jgi:hypothetical protein